MTVWTIGISAKMETERAFIRLMRDTPREVVAATESGQITPTRARGHSQLADLLTRELFPPSYDRAHEEMARAIALTPLDSAMWVQAARFQMLRGNLQEARAALNVSDQIDPLYPAQRIEAIRLWGLLGDRDRATTIARNVAVLGSPFREEAAGELAAIGVPPREIFALVSNDSLGSEALFNLTRSIIEADPTRVEATIRELPPEVVREADFRRRLAVLLERTSRFELLLSVWELDGAELIEPLPGLFVANTELRFPPRPGIFPLGWQVPASTADLEYRWDAPSGNIDGSQGALELIIGSEAGSRVRWGTYKTVMPAGKAVKAVVRLRQDPFYGGVITMRGRTYANLIHGPSTNPQIAGWVELSVTMPAQERPSILELELDWQRRGMDSDDRRTVITIDGIEFLEPEAQP